jgi:hypothetical protein
VQHCPDWLVDWFWGHTKAKNLRQLVRGPLAGRARVQLAGETGVSADAAGRSIGGPSKLVVSATPQQRCNTPFAAHRICPTALLCASIHASTPCPPAGDLHFMMRHSFKQYGPGQSPSLAPSEMPTPAGACLPACVARLSSCVGCQPGQRWCGLGYISVGLPGQQDLPGWLLNIAWGSAECRSLCPHLLLPPNLALRLAAGMSPAGGSPLGGSPLGGSPTASRLSSRSATPQPGLRSYLSPSQLHQSLINRLGGTATAPSAAGSSSTVPAGQAGSLTPQKQPQQAGASPPLVSPLGSSPERPWSPLPGGGSPKQLQGPTAMGGRLPRHAASGQLSGSEIGEISLAAFGSPDSATTSSSTQPISIGSRLAAAMPAGGPALPLLSPVRRGSRGGSVGGEADGLQLGTSPPPAGSSSRPGSASLGMSSPSGPGAGADPSSSSPFNSWWPGLRVRTSASSQDLTAAAAAAAAAGAATDSAMAAGGSLRRSNTFASMSSLDLGGGHAANGRVGGGPASSTSGGPPPGWHLNDPEHLVVCGSGGAFCHPTHVFSEARFRPEFHPAAGPIYIKPPPGATGSAAAAGPGSAGGNGGGLHQQQPGSGMGGVPSSGGGLQRGFPSGSSLYSMGHRGSEAEQRRPAGGEYRCEQAFPNREQVGGAVGPALGLHELPAPAAIVGMLDSALLQMGSPKQLLKDHSCLRCLLLFPPLPSPACAVSEAGPCQPHIPQREQPL